MIEPLKPPVHCGGCFHGLFYPQNNPIYSVWLFPYYNEKLRVRDVKNDFHIPLVYGRVRITTVTGGVSVLPFKKPREYFGFRELTTDESAPKWQKVNLILWAWEGVLRIIRTLLCKIMEKPMMPLSQRQWWWFYCVRHNRGQKMQQKRFPSFHFSPSSW